MWTRNWALSYIIYQIYEVAQNPLDPAIAAEILEHVVLIKWGSVFMLTCLSFLQYYWLAMFFQILHHYATRGEAEDL